MENHQNQETPRAAAGNSSNNNKPSGGNHRGTHRGGRGGHHRRPQPKKSTEEVVEQKSTEAVPASQENKNNAPKQQQKSGDKNRNNRNRGRGGKGNGNKDNDAQNQAPQQSGEPKRRSKDSGTIDSSVSFQNGHSLFGSADFMSDSSFLPTHEEHKPDPEAEKYAASILDAEGPLLFREEPVQAAQTEAPAAEGEEDNTPVEIVGIRFRTTGKVYFFDPGALKLKQGSHAVVETARGLEYGEVARANATVSQKQIVLPLRPVIRAATAEDDQHYAENKARENEAFRTCQEKIAAHGLDMKLVEAEYTFDNTKLLFYFTSAGRVDFRELVKDLAGVFRTRIELRQIGIRDEAKLLGGLGTCGRPLCCASVLADFVQVSIKMAKEQNLSLNSTKISGCCGRLMCCLRYESDTYEEEIRRTPSVGSLLKTPDGEGNVISNNPLRGTVRVRLGGEEGTIKEYHRDDVHVLKGVTPPKED